MVAGFKGTALKGRNLNWVITATAGAGFLLFGYDQGVMSGLLTGDAFTGTFPEIDTTGSGHGSSSLQGTVVAIYEIGCFFGAIFCLLMGERLGRRRCIMSGCVVLSVGAILQATAYGIPQLIVGRIVAGLGNGMNTSTIPVWHSELMKAKARGRGLAIELAINIFGVMLAYWVDYGMSYVDGHSQFRFPLALQVLFATLTFTGVVFLPESPRWLVAHDRHDEARRIMWAVRCDEGLTGEDDPGLIQSLGEIQDAIREEREAAETTSFKAMLRDGPQRFRYRTLLGIGGQFMQQISGINLITYYAPVIFQQSVGMSHSLSLLIAGFNGVAYFFSSLTPIWIIDRMGRRKLMLFAAAGQCFCMAILAGTVYDGSKASGVVATVMLFLFNFFFAVGLLAIPWLLPAEYAPLAIRTRAAALATASNWIFTFLVVEITPVSIGNIGYRTYIYFSIFNFLFLPLIYFFYPETQRLSLEQIDKLFERGKVMLRWDPSMGVPGEAPERTGLEKSGMMGHIERSTDQRDS
ncbi:Sugar (and other) transporter [Geosmithia morbida]|uniref:Sugar (And other) transporter n=1 Tax=Geosmithia morbida TaxID=1094350 RepID=A0A9P5D135_9HYPO|nr:Sugar (and other) transporter [Geosmithia morbida]KAF4122312.1 Sugar (and other) transporter [Geosmithia morbida]